MQFPQQTTSSHCNDNRAVEAGLPLRSVLLSHTLAWNMRTRKEPTKQATDEPKNETRLTLILLTWRILWAPNNGSKWQMGLNSGFKGLNRGNNISNMYWIHCNDNRAVEAGLPLRGALVSHTLARNMWTRKKPTKQATNEPMNETRLDRGNNISNMYRIQQQEKTGFIDKFVAFRFTVPYIVMITSNKNAN